MERAEREGAGEADHELGRLKVFISYSRADVQFADELELALHQNGFEPMIDRSGIDPGEAWKQRLGEMILGCDTVVFVLTAASARSATCAWEAAEAAQLLKRILVVSPNRLPDSERPPPELAGINWIHCWANPEMPGSSYERGVAQLARALRTDSAWLRQRTALQEQAARWRARGAASDSPILLRSDLLSEALAWARAAPRDAEMPSDVAAYISASDALAAVLKAEAEAGLAQREAAIAGVQKASRQTPLWIFFWNFAGLTVLVVGALLMTELRSSLIDAQYRAMRTQGDMIANLLIETGTVQGDPLPGVNEPAVRQVLSRLLPSAERGRAGSAGPRVRVFAADGMLVADSDVIYDRLNETPLPAPGAAPIPQAAPNLAYLRITPWRPTTTLEQEQAHALQGEITSGERLNEAGERVLSVTIPLRRVQMVVATVTLEAADPERILVAERVAMTPFLLAAALVTGLSSLLLTLLVARPLRRLAEAAGRAPAERA